MGVVLSALDAAWKVLLAGLLLGAGLPALFALGVRSLAWGAGGEAVVTENGVTQAAPNPWGRVVASALFAVVVLAIAMGISYIVAHGFGYSITFNGSILPTIAKK